MSTDIKPTNEYRPTTAYEYLLNKYGVTLTFEQASEEIGLHWQTIREMCLRGEIKAIKAGRKWILTTKALAEYLDNGVSTETIIQIPQGRHRKIV